MLLQMLAQLTDLCYTEEAWPSITSKAKEHFSVLSCGIRRYIRNISVKDWSIQCVRAKMLQYQN